MVSMAGNSKLNQRVTTAADRVLKRSGAVGPVDLLVEMGLITRGHFEQWKRRDPSLSLIHI